MGNTFKTAFLLTAMTLLLMAAGRALGGPNGMLLALGIAAVTNFVAYFFSDKIALRTYRAQVVTREQLPRVYSVVERLTQKIGLPMPKIYVIPTDSPNAFATGRNPKHASVAVTEGILNLLNDEELEGVLAHELGHVNNRDILISSVAATIAGAITWLRYGAYFNGMGVATIVAAEAEPVYSCCFWLQSRPRSSRWRFPARANTLLTRPAHTSPAIRMLSPAPCPSSMPIRVAFP